MSKLVPTARQTKGVRCPASDCDSDEHGFLGILLTPHDGPVALYEHGGWEWSWTEEPTPEQLAEARLLIEADGGRA